MCPNCQSQTDSIEIENLIISYCKECWNHITYKDKVCDNHNPIFVKFYYQNNTAHLRKQCFTCGKIESNAYSKSLVSDFNSLPDADLSFEKNIDYDRIQKIFKRYSEKSKDFNKQVDLDNFLDEHSVYLKTDDWKKKRNLVLKRDTYLCQSCLENKAVEVHHKSYRYWKNEPLFELVSVCKICHDKITEMNREIINFKKVIKKE